MEIEELSAAKDFLDELELFGKSWNYIYSTKATLRDFARSCKGENATEFDVPADVTEDDIKKWLKDMTDRGLSEKSRIKDVSKLHRFFVFLTESPKYNLKYNPLARISKQLPRPNKQTQRPIKSVDEISKMIRSIFHVRDRTIVVLLAKTG